jgi:flagellar basal-body rod protein FlgB
MPISAASPIDQIAAAMSVKSLQHQVIASNIANRDTPGYQRMKVEFDRALRAGHAPQVTLDATGTAVSLEHDVVALSSNAGQYAALARALSRYFAILSTITSPSRG